MPYFIIDTTGVHAMYFQAIELPSLLKFGCKTSERISTPEPSELIIAEYEKIMNSLQVKTTQQNTPASNTLTLKQYAFVGPDNIPEYIIHNINNMISSKAEDYELSTTTSDASFNNERNEGVTFPLFEGAAQIYSSYLEESTITEQDGDSFVFQPALIDNPGDQRETESDVFYNNKKRKFDDIDDQTEHHPINHITCLPNKEARKWVVLLDECIKDYRKEIIKEQKKLRSLSRTLEKLEKTQEYSGYVDDEDGYDDAAVDDELENYDNGAEQEQDDSAKEDEEKLRETRTIQLYQQLIEYAKEQLIIIQSSSSRSCK
ncbi:hypothetical protein BDA99DRAFT_576349 [Phascolomyces articulosus]|uniref:Uncharacterized protein n=1 Tax=Phascolomyces articulosus TaxID=60185 RepID=A0AAD5K220_9FUNG|nr:hypothetical protein BDA99DRAFT_576349 [Phascolomyces articulosus]